MNAKDYPFAYAFANAISNAVFVCDEQEAPKIPRKGLRTSQRPSRLVSSSMDAEALGTTKRSRSSDEIDDTISLAIEIR